MNFCHSCHPASEAIAVAASQMRYQRYKNMDSMFSKEKLETEKKGDSSYNGQETFSPMIHALWCIKAMDTYTMFITKYLQVS